MERLDYKIVGLAIVFVLCWMGYLPLACRGAEVWSDDFDDGNYDGWIVHEGNFSAANHYLESTEIDSSTGWAFIRRETNVSTGTWSFDCYLPSGSDSISVSPHTDDNSNPDDDFVGYSFIEITPNRVSLWIRRATGGVGIVGEWSSTFSETWTHIDLTVDEDMIFDVFVNGVHRIHYGDASHLTGDYRYFVFNSETEGHAIDNVVVSDTPTPPPPPLILWLVLGGAAVAVTVLAIVFLRRR